MPRRENISVGEYYHIYNRENSKQNLFLEERDWIRFLFLVLYLQSPISFNNMGRPVSYFVRHRRFNISGEDVINIVKNRYVELINFCLMPNHFHITAREVKEGGISKYLQRIQIAYTKYLNTKHEKSGHLFQGSFRSVHIKNNEQLLHLSAYIHRNPREINQWKNKENQYPWSSYQDYVQENRWGALLKREIILGQFSNVKEYKNFVETSGTKLLLNETHLI
ncbi:MAG: transposase [Candidatus Parcubacteria bacterium]|nr:transposase [Candidatus Parcubacteria bacterium]